MRLPEVVVDWGVGPILGVTGIAAALLLQLTIGLALVVPGLRWWVARHGGPATAAWRDWLGPPTARPRRRLFIATLLSSHLFGLLVIASFPRLPAALGETLRRLVGGGGASTLLQLAPWGLLRLAVSVALAGLLLLAVAGRGRSGAPPGLARAGGWIAAGGLGAALPSAWLAAGTLTGWQLEALRGELDAAALAAWLGPVAATLLALGLAALLWQGSRWPALVAARTTGALLALALVAAGSGELAREALRRPWLIGSGRSGVLYVNGLTPDEVQRGRADGLASVRPAIGDGGAASGAAIFRAACTPCHSPGALRGLLDGLPPAAIAAWLPRLERMRGRMPPFPGNAADAAALTQFLAGLDGRLDERLPMPSEPLIAAGRRVMEYRCYNCHRDVPLRRRVAGWTVPFAWEAIGRLPALYPAMPAFAGDDEERRALAAWLAALGAGHAD